MKKIIAFVLIIIVIQEWDSINGFINPPPDYSLIDHETVVLYSTSWCGYCEKARTFMDKNGIDYKEYDIEKSREGREQHDALGGGGIPVLLINDEVVRGYDPKKIIKLLNES